MGLNTTHGAWDGPYSSFGYWRTSLAKIAGYKTVMFADRETYRVDDWDKFIPANFQGEWEKTPDDPLLVLLVHSDCDGVIHPQQAEALAKRLQELLPKIEDNYILEKTETFIRGLQAASSDGEDVEFL